MTTANDWVIYRCSPALTVWLSDRLHDGGQEVYTPQITIRRRVPRTRRFEEKQIALMPSFIFLRPSTPIAPALKRKLRPLVVNGKVRTATSWEIADMRGLLGVSQFMANNPRKDPQFTLNVGDWVSICAGPLRGIRGVISSRNSDYCQLETNSFLGTLNISTFLLRKSPA